MTENLIHPDTKIDRVALSVPNLERSLDFYQKSLGLQLISRGTQTGDLGAGEHSFVTLLQRPGKPRNPRDTGLYHMAILVPTRADLARMLKHLADIGVPLEGFSDHLVSEAIYLSDPDGNGIEIYRDRPRAEWETSADGQIRMSTDPLDLRGLAAELKNEDGFEKIATGTRLGHIHLQVSNLQDAQTFYTRVLGFQVTARNYPGARFVSAGGYHHHIGMNTWNSAGGLPSPPDSQSLVYFVIKLPDKQELNRVAQWIKDAGASLEETPDGLMTHDPSRNAILLTA